MSKVKKLTCKQCGNTWEPRKPHPIACPACISRKWNVAPKKAKGKKKVATSAKKAAAPKKAVARPKKVAPVAEKEAP